jgi:hypothetical protein
MKCLKFGRRRLRSVAVSHRFKKHRLELMKEAGQSKLCFLSKPPKILFYKIKDTVFYFIKI